MLLVAAEKREFGGLLPRVRKGGRLRWPVDFACSGVLGNRRVLLVANGPGPKLAAEAVEAALLRAPADAVVSTGYCGAVDTALQVGDIIIASEVISIEQQTVYRTEAPECVGQRYCAGPVISQDWVAGTVEEKRRLRERGGMAVEMEAAAVAQKAREAGVSFYCVRVVSDGAEEEFALDLNAMRRADGRFSSARILMATLRNPLVLGPELRRLVRQSRLAALKLGEFLATCRF